MSRRKTLHVVDLTPRRPSEPALREMVGFLDVFEAEEGPTTTHLIHDVRRGGFHPDHNRMLKRGGMTMEVSYCGRDRTGTLVASLPERNGVVPMSVEMPFPHERIRCPDRTLAHLRAVIDRVLGSQVTSGDLGIVETWTQGLAAIAMNRGSSQVGVWMPTPWTPLVVDADDGTYDAIPKDMRRRISTTCPFIVNVSHDDPTDSRPCRIEIEQFSRPYPRPDGTSPDTVATMRSVAMVLATANLKPEDLTA